MWKLVSIMCMWGNFQWMAQLVTVTQVAEADGCWWLFQIATGFADIPRIVRIFSELCEYFQNCGTNIGPNYSAGPLPNIADAWFCKIQHHFYLSCIRRTILNCLNFNELHFVHKNYFVYTNISKMLFNDQIAAKNMQFTNKKLPASFFSVVSGYQLSWYLPWTFTMTNKFLAKSFAVVSTP